MADRSVITLRLPNYVLDALDAWIAAQVVSPTRNSAIIEAIKRFLDSEKIRSNNEADLRMVQHINRDQR